ncbi:gas vesicle protein [Streptomyces sp. NPDC004065]|uniref:gas vesicle protein GvpO n=1 Tax=Streptomyces sp. NPDC004065 TaxID=3364689 RepID=UPI00384A715F
MANTENTSEPQESQQPRKTPRKSQESHTEEDNRATARRPRPMEVLREAKAQFAELTNLEAESVTSFERTGDGWSLEVEVLELSRVPDTMSLMASYLVELDDEGQLTGYRRLRRYERGRADGRRSG